MSTCLMFRHLVSEKRKNRGKRIRKSLHSVVLWCIRCVYAYALTYESSWTASSQWDNGSTMTNYLLRARMTNPLIIAYIRCMRRLSRSLFFNLFCDVLFEPWIFQWISFKCAFFTQLRHRLSQMSTEKLQFQWNVDVRIAIFLFD